MPSPSAPSQLNLGVSSAMNTIGTTLVFSAAFAVMGLADAYGENIPNVLLGLVLTLPVGAFAFWVGAQKAHHHWYSAIMAGVVAFGVISATLRALGPQLSGWALLATIVVVLAALSFFLGRLPSFPRTANETRS